MSPGRSTALLSSTGSPRFVPRQFCPDQRSPTKDQADQGRLKYLVSRSPPVWPHRKGAIAAGKRLQNCKENCQNPLEVFTGTLNTVYVMYSWFAGGLLSLVLLFFLLTLCCTARWLVGWYWCCCCSSSSSSWHCVALPGGWRGCRRWVPRLRWAAWQQQQARCPLPGGRSDFLLLTFSLLEFFT